MPYPPPNQGQPGRAPQQTAGPGGAYGSMPATSAPYPGQPPAIGMAKPGTVTGIQVILWIFSVISAIGDLFSIVGLVNYFSPLGVLTLLVALYFTVQSLISPVHIERGKRWAWIWSVVTAVIGLVFAFIMILFSLSNSQFFGGAALLGLLWGGLYGVLLGLLLSPSAKEWILMHRVQRGEVQATAATGPDLPNAQAALGATPRRPERRPTVVTVAQVLFAALVIPVLLVTPHFIEEFGHEADIYDYPSLSAYLDEYNYWGVFIATGIAGLLVLVINCFIAYGLGRGRLWARVFGLIWLGVMVLPMGIGALATGMRVQQQKDDRMPAERGGWIDDPFTPMWLPTMFWGLTIGTVLVVVAFVLLLTRGARDWTPGKPPAIVVIQPR